MKTQAQAQDAAHENISQDFIPMTTPHTLSSAADVAIRHFDRVDRVDWIDQTAGGSSSPRPSVRELVGRIPGVTTASYLQPDAPVAVEQGGARIHAFPGSSAGVSLPRGALSELSGSPGGGKTEIALELLLRASEASRAAKFRVAWIEPSLTLYPPALEERGFELKQFFCVEATDTKQALWCAHQLLKSRLFEAVVIKPTEETSAYSEVDLRRLQIAARKSDGRVIFLPERPTERGAWSLALQLKVEGRKIQRLRQVGQHDSGR